MKNVVVYESMYGNTRAIAYAIAEGLSGDTVVVPLSEANQHMLARSDLVVVGGPTHTFGLSRPESRKAAAEAAAKPDSGLVLEPDAAGEGLREWLPTLTGVPADVAVFDTRIRMAGIVGHASRRAARILRRAGVHLIAGPESFFVTKDNQVRPGQAQRARQWGGQLAALLRERGTGTRNVPR